MGKRPPYAKINKSCGPSEDINQSDQSASFALNGELSHSKGRESNVQAYLNLRWAHMIDVIFFWMNATRCMTLKDLNT